MITQRCIMQSLLTTLKKITKANVPHVTIFQLVKGINDIRGPRKAPTVTSSIGCFYFLVFLFYNF